MTADVKRGTLQIRFYWRDIDAVLADMRGGAAGKFKGTLDGNFPAVECEDKADYERLLRLFPVRP